MAMARLSLMGIVSSWLVVSTVVAAAVVMAVIPMVMAEVGLEVTLVVPPPTVVEERRETGLPALPGGGAHGSPAWSELEGSGGTTARPEVVHLPASRGVLAVDIPLFSKEDTRVEPSAIPPS